MAIVFNENTGEYEDDEGGNAPTTPNATVNTSMNNQLKQFFGGSISGGASLGGSSSGNSQSPAPNLPQSGANQGTPYTPQAGKLQTTPEQWSTQQSAPGTAYGGAGSGANASIPGNAAAGSGGDPSAQIHAILAQIPQNGWQQALAPGSPIRAQLEALGVEVQTASDGTARGRLNKLPAGMDQDLGFKQYGWADAPGHSGGAGAGPAAGTGVGVSTGAGTTTQGPVDPAMTAALKNTLMQRLGVASQIPTLNDQALSAQMDAYERSQDKGLRRGQSRLAERAYATGMTEGAYDATLQGDNYEAASERGEFGAGLVGDELLARRGEMLQLLAMGNQMLSEEENRALTLQLKQIDNQLAQQALASGNANFQQQLNQQNQQYYDNLSWQMGQSAAQINQNLLNMFGS